MTESQQSICEWADATFGVATDVSIAARALKEMAKLVTACVNGKPAERIGEEIADVVIVLARLGRSLGDDVLVRVLDAGLPTESPLHAVTTANDYLASLISALSYDNSGWARMSLRDLGWMLGELAQLLAISIPAAIDRKMSINRARRWKLDGNGHGQHVEESAP